MQQGVLLSAELDGTDPVPAGDDLPDSGTVEPDRVSGGVLLPGGLHVAGGVLPGVVLPAGVVVAGLLPRRVLLPVPARARVRVCVCAGEAGVPLRQLLPRVLGASDPLPEGVLLAGQRDGVRHLPGGLLLRRHVRPTEGVPSRLLQSGGIGGVQEVRLRVLLPHSDERGAVPGWAVLPGWAEGAVELHGGVHVSQRADVHADDLRLRDVLPGGLEAGQAVRGWALLSGRLGGEPAVSGGEHLFDGTVQLHAEPMRDVRFHHGLAVVHDMSARELLPAWVFEPDFLPGRVVL